MQKKFSLKVLPSQAADPLLLTQLIAEANAVQPDHITGYHILKRSIDARGKKIWINLTLNVFINEPFHNLPLFPLELKDVHHAEKKVLIIGAGPAGLFA